MLTIPFRLICGRLLSPVSELHTVFGKASVLEQLMTSLLGGVTLGSESRLQRQSITYFGNLGPRLCMRTQIESQQAGILMRGFVRQTLRREIIESGNRSEGSVMCDSQPALLLDASSADRLLADCWRELPSNWSRISCWVLSKEMRPCIQGGACGGGVLGNVMCYLQKRWSVR